MAKAVYSEAPEVEEIANDLIEKYHPHLKELDVKIRYLFIDKAPSSKGREVWGTCRKVSGLSSYLEGKTETPLFVITISEDVWSILPSDKRLALVDHELCHAGAEIKEGEDEDVVKLSTKPHDLEEFVCIVRRHGLWREDVQSFVDAAKSR